MGFFSRLTSVGRLAASQQFRSSQPFINEVKIKSWEVAGCIGASFFLIYNIWSDRSKHVKMFCENMEEGKEYMDPKNNLRWNLMPDASFIINNATSDGHEAVAKKMVEPIDSIVQKEIEFSDMSYSGTLNFRKKYGGHYNLKDSSE